MWNGRVKRLAAALFVLSCSGSHARLHVRQASSFPIGPLSISVLGVYRGGRLNEAASATLASEMSRVLEPAVCTAGYGEALLRLNAEAWSALHEHVAADGIGDEFLGGIAPAAEGAHILVLELFGPLAAFRDAVDVSTQRVLLANSGAVIHSDARPSTYAPAAPDFEISASIFPVHRGSTEALLSFSYTGSGPSEAIQQFAEELAVALPGITCSGWNWGSVKVAHERDMAGFSLRRFRLLPITAD